MSQEIEEESLEVVDLDSLSGKKSIAIAAAVTFLLGMVPYSYMLFCLHYLLGGLAAAGHFAKRHGVTIGLFQGAKLGAISATLGMLVAYLFPFFMMPQVTDEEWAEISEQFVNEAYASGNPEAADVIEKMLVADNVSMFLTVMLVIGLLASVILGALGGMLGSSLFKRGPLAQ